MSASLMRYAVVGAAATAAHWLTLAALVEVARLPAWLASGLGAVVGAQLAFVGNCQFTFAHQGAGLPAWWPAWWRFMATAAVGALAGMAIVGAGVALGLHYLLAQAAATLLVMLGTFAVNRRWAFGG